MTIRLAGLGDVACREELNIAWADIHRPEIALEFCRCHNDRNTALKYLRRQSEVNAAPLIELAQKTPITAQAAPAQAAPAQAAIPAATESSSTTEHVEVQCHVQLELDRLCQVVGRAIKTDVFRRRLINYEEEHTLKACFFLSLPNSYDRKRSHNEKAANATHFKADGGEDNKAGFAFVREDGAVLPVCPRWNDIDIDAYWLSEELLTALAAQNFMFKGGAGGSWGAGTFKFIKGMCKLKHFKFSTYLWYADWEQNHGMPWGAGPAKTYWPRGRYGENGEMAPMPEDMCKAKMDQAMLKSLLRKRANLAVYTAQAENRHTAGVESVPPHIT